MLTKLLLIAIPFCAPAAHAETVDELVAKGRVLLAEGRPAEAEVVFQEAEKLDGSTLKTRMWSLRSWLPQGRVNDALNAIDKLDREGKSGAEMDYLYGMAFAFKAKGYIQERAPSGVVDMAFTDAVSYLEKATKADGVRFFDAFAPLAESAWYARNLPLARVAADKAVTVQPNDPEVQLILGQVALAQFVEANAKPAEKAAADKHWEAASAANQRAATLLSALATPEAKARSATPHLELARLFGWKKKPDDAAREYGLALGFDPSVVDFNEVQGALDAPQFLSTLQAGAQNFAASWGAEHAGDATILWWLGFAQFQQKQYAEAETAFVAALKKRPDFHNAWFYTALARYHQQKYPEAIEAFVQHFTNEPVDLVRSIDEDRARIMPIVEYLVGWCARKQMNLEAAQLCEIQVAVEPDNAQYWNNVGLFYRDGGDVLAKSKKEEDKTRAKVMWEKALIAYEKSLALSPEDPNYMNDLAVVLDYNLQRDLQRAKALYEKSLTRANEELARTDLSPELVELRKLAARDAKNNLDRLVRRMEKAKEKEKEKEPEKQ